jgi:hypothetical protein
MGDGAVAGRVSTRSLVGNDDGAQIHVYLLKY